MIPVQEIGVSKERLIDYMQFLWPSLETYKKELKPLLFGPHKEEEQYVLYICPICLEHIIYFQPQVAIASSEFSCDHFPPKNVGGNAQALVCKRCNNTAGHEFDFVTRDFLRERALNMRVPGTVVQTRVKISDVVGKYKSEVFVDEKGDIGFSFLPEWNINAAPLQEFLANEIQKNKWKADIIIPRTNTEKAERAFIKAAYLACFHHWGYEFIFSDTGMHMRNVMAGKEKYPFKNIPAFIFDTPELLAQIPVKVCFITSPLEWNVFAVNVPLTLSDNNYKCLASVLIPGPGKWDNLSKLNDLIDPEIDRQVTFTPFDPSLLRKEYRGYSKESNMMYGN